MDDVPPLDRRIRNANSVQLFIEMISRYGPDVTQIADATGIFKETVRYRYKRFLERGFIVRAVPHYENLRMKRLILIASFSESLDANIDTLLAAMHELCYLRKSHKVMFSSDYILHVDCPNELVQRCRNVFQRLKEVGVLSKLEIFEFETTRVHPLKAEMYDFDDKKARPLDQPQHQQLLDSNVKQRKSVHHPDTISSRVSFDYIDLLILMELTTDATRRLIVIAEKLGLKYNSLLMHYKQHVMGRELIRSFEVSRNLLNENHNREGKAGRRRLLRWQKTLPVSFLIRDIAAGEKLRMASLLSSLPIAFEAAGTQHYFVTLRLPYQEHTVALKRISSYTALLDRKCASYTIDESRSVEFPLPYQQFSRDLRVWQLDEGRALARFENFVLKARIGGAGRLSSSHH